MRSSTRRILLLSALTLIAAAVAAAQARFPSDSIPKERMEGYSDLAVQWMQEYLRIDTSNPPGNEARATAWFKQKFDAEGIENKTFEYLPGRGDLWARLPHNVPDAEAKRPIILLNHMDVVTSDAARWKVPPFSGQIVDEPGGPAIYGRGAQDMKCDGLAELMVMVMAKREKVRLERDIIFLAVSDEEAEGTGTDWFIAHQRPLLGNAEFLINEGGENVMVDGKVNQVAVDTAEKSPFWLRVEAHGRPGHGSRPNVESAPNRLVAALDRILAWHTPLKMLPVTEEFMKALAPTQPAERRNWFENPQAAVKDPAFARWVETDELINYMVRNTISLTMLGGSQQTNVIPPVAWANLDVRLLPGEDQNAFLAAIRHVVNDPNVEITPQSKEFRVANAAPPLSHLMRSIQRASARYWPGAIVATKMTSGYTENQRYRPLGIAAYGFSAYGNTEEEGASEHGNNERIRVEEVRRGARVLYDVVLGVD